MVEPNRIGGFPFRKANAEERKKDFSEVQLSYSEEDVMREAERCLLCGTPVCIDACPVLLDVRGMNEAVVGEISKHPMNAYEKQIHYLVLLLDVVLSYRDYVKTPVF